MSKKGLKRFLAVTVGAVSLLGLAACAGGGEASSSTEESKGLEFTYELKTDGTYDIAGMSYGDKSQVMSLEIPAEYEGKAVTSISNLSSFGVCELTIPKSITAIGEDAFKEMYYNVACDKTLKADDGNYIFKLYYTGTLEDWAKIDFENEESNPAYKLSTSGATLDRYHNEFYCDNGSGTTEQVTKIEVTAEDIGDYQFGGFNQVEEIKLTATKTVGNDAFYRCIGVKKVSLGVVEEIGEYAFWQCNSLEELDLGTALVEIGMRAFGYAAKNLESIAMPATVKYIHYDIFAYNNGASVGKGSSVEIVTFPSGSKWAFFSEDDYKTGGTQTSSSSWSFSSQNFVALNSQSSHSSEVMVRVSN